VRLAFAVAAHLLADILIVDEVLAVGDAEFQKKCIGKMKDVSAGEGRTVLFVSHNMGTIAQLCTQSLILKNGTINYIGQTKQTIEYYLKQDKALDLNLVYEKTDTSKMLYFSSIRNIDEHFKTSSIFSVNKDITLEFALSANQKLVNGIEISISLYDNIKRRVFTIHEPVNKLMNRNEPSKKFKLTIPKNFLTPGNYSWLMATFMPGVQLLDVIDDVCNFTIVDDGTKFAAYENAHYGCVFIHDYQIEAI
jgi:lipopolysaccharide transport system ATP-binding protein